MATASHKPIILRNDTSMGGKTKKMAAGTLLLRFVFLSVQIIFVHVAFAVGASPIFNVKGFGASGSGTNLDTLAIQSAIDAAHRAGGGVVLLPAGTYLSGSLRLKSNVKLQIETNATLLGSDSFADYEKGNWYALLLANAQTNAGISGQGIIDGQGLRLARDAMRRAVAGEFGPASLELQRRRERDLRLSDAEFGPQSIGDRVNETHRPLLIEFRNCRQVTISGVTLRNSSCWVQNYIQCCGLLIENIHVASTAYWNNDGIDITDCRDVLVRGCDIDSADDGICLKSQSSTNRCENVDISDCRIRSSASAFKLGTASFGGFRNIHARHLYIYDTFRSAVALESVDGGTLENVCVEDVVATNTGNAIFLRLGHRNSNGPVGELKNVTISNLTAEIPSGKPDAGYKIIVPSSNRNHNLHPSVIAGLPGHNVSNVVLRNIQITYAGGGKPAHASSSLDDLGRIPEKAGDYPEFSMFGELPSWGFYVRHTEGIEFYNCHVSLQQPDFRPAFVFDDVRDLRMHTVGLGSQSGEPAMILNNVHDAAYSDIKFPEGMVEKIRLNGKSSADLQK